MAKNITTGGVLMKKIRLLTLLLTCCAVCCLAAQDHLPDRSSKDESIGSSRPLREIKALSDTIVVHVSLPNVFQNTSSNQIIDSLHLLTPVLERFRLVRAGISDDSVRIVHIGDSHIRGHVYPQTIGNRLIESFGAVSYTDIGVNGATCLTFAQPERIAAIAALNPELLILSFGTNESHNRGYIPDIHYQQIDELIKLLRTALPGVPILFTTPPGSYDSFRKRRRRRTYAVNPRTVTAVKTIQNYARTHGLVVWDLYTIAGGSRRACRNWMEAGLMRPDHVHYLSEGYTLQGELLHEAIIKAYNNYVSY